MTALSDVELAAVAMDPIWNALKGTKAFKESMTRFVLEELPPGTKFDAAGMTAANALCCEFRNEIWPHHIPTVWELILADQAGKLEEKISELGGLVRTIEECRDGGHLWMGTIKHIGESKQICPCGATRWVDKHGAPLRATERP